MLTQRLGSSTQKDDVFNDALLNAILSNPGSCDEVWLATDYGFPKLEHHRESAKTLSKVAVKYREAGIRVSLQLSNSIGHGQYMSSCDCSGLVYDGSPVEKMVGPDGKAADYCFCWRGENLRKYVSREITYYASEIQPHTVWIDDDLRATNHNPVRIGCFCDDCIAKFNAEYNSAFTRDDLVREINHGKPEWRLRWIEFVRKGLYDFTYMVSKAVHDVSPDTYMGYQYCANGGYTGFAYDFIFGAMRDATGKNPKSRPGGGSYNDHNPNTFIDKATLLNWQNAMLPDYVAEIRPEIENLPDVQFGKSVAGCCLETSIYLANGANAMSYAMIMNDYEPMEWHAEMLKAFSEHRSYWKKLCEANNGTYQSGLINYIARDGYKRKLDEGEGDFSWTGEAFYQAMPIAHAAIPVAVTTRESKYPVYLLHPQNARSMSDDEVRVLLTKPVMCDGEALSILSSRGFGFGARAIAIPTGQLYEKYTDHQINNRNAGRIWSESFFVNSGWRLEDIGGTTEAFGVYETHSLNLPPMTDDPRLPYGIANAVVTTEAGAKWAVFGQNPWQNVISSEKRSQILSAVDYISGNAVGAILETPCEAIVLPRENGDGRITSVSVLNCTVGPTKPLVIRIRRPAAIEFSVMSAASECKKLAYDRDGDDYLVTLPPVAAWNIETLFIG